MFQPNEHLGPYTLLQKLGNGQFGVVWKAQKREGMAPPCAIKLPLDPDIKWADVEKEARVWLQVTGHLNVLPLIEANQYDGQIVLVSEYVEGGSLLGWLRQHGGKAPSVKNALAMMDGILAGLEHLHQCKVIHRDLKPANILLQHGSPRIADFGLSRILSSTQSYELAGALAYMSPEAFDSKSERTVKTDIWAAGVILYKLLTGRLPFPQQGQGPLINAILNEPPAPLPSDLPEPLRAIVICALEKDLANRYESAAAMREALLRVDLTHDLIAQEKRIKAQAVLADLPSVLDEIAQRQTVFIIAVDDEPGGRGKHEFVLAPEAVGKRVLGLVDEEYGWPKTVEADQVRAISALVPGHQYHPFVQRHNKCVAVGISLWEYEKIKQRIQQTKPAPSPNKEARKPPEGNRRRTIAMAAGGLVLLLLGIGIGVWNRPASDIASSPTPTPTATPAATPDTPAPTPTLAALSSFVEDLSNGVKLEMISVPGGTFQMGAPTSEPGHLNGEEPQHQVTVASFAIGKYEVTQTQWQAVMETNPSGFKGDDLPVENVSWQEAQEFCRKLSERTGKSYRLPTEAEWEYACRADTTGAYARTLDELAWYSKNSGSKTHPIGQKKANAFGLYDMHGNVWEWCQDWFGSYPSTAVTDPKGPDSGSLRVFRGGGWLSRAARCRSAFRYYQFPDTRLIDVGVRLLRTLE